MERILRSSTTVFLHGRPGLFMLLSSPVRSFFLRMYQTVDLTTPSVHAIYLMDLFCFWSLTIVCFTCMERSFDHDVVQQQLPNANDTLSINSRPFTCLTDVEITKKNSPCLSMKQLLSQLSNYLWSLGKGGRYILKSCNSLTFPPSLMRIHSN